jgi:hypothetical protein
MACSAGAGTLALASASFCCEIGGASTAMAGGETSGGGGDDASDGGGESAFSAALAACAGIWSAMMVRSTCGEGSWAWIDRSDDS